MNRASDNPETGTAPTGDGGAGLAFEPDIEGQNTILRSLPLPVMITEASSGRFLELNDAALALFGVKRQDILGKTPTDAGVDLVIDYSSGSRSSPRASVAMVKDTAGARVSCRLFSTHADAGGRRIVISVLLDSQLESVVKGRSSRQESVPGHGEAEARQPQTFTGKPVVMLVEPEEAAREADAGMLAMLGFDVVSGASMTEVLGVVSAARKRPVLVIADHPSTTHDELTMVSGVLPGVPFVLPHEPGQAPPDGYAPGPMAIVQKPLSINDLADAVSRLLARGR
ncbi:PAS domain-containing protein [Candidatus Fermentibacteria bacterium]|nr:PAS domain-containing protein [Candidatus Fermentibacteria bacterium]